MNFFLRKVFLRKRVKISGVERIRRKGRLIARRFLKLRRRSEEVIKADPDPELLTEEMMMELTVTEDPPHLLQAETLLGSLVVERQRFSEISKIVDQCESDKIEIQKLIDNGCMSLREVDGETLLELLLSERQRFSEVSEIVGQIKSLKRKIQKVIDNACMSLREFGEVKVTREAELEAMIVLKRDWNWNGKVVFGDVTDHDLKAKLEFTARLSDIDFV